MYRRELKSDHGMLFKFPNPLNASFWGMNTYIPLDLAFVNPDMKISEITSITPMSTRQVISKYICSMAIETNSGFFKNNGIEVGSSVNIVGDEIHLEPC